MFEKLQETQERLEPHLLPGYYSFIGPVNQEYIAPLLQTANEIAPVVSLMRSMHHVLSNKQAVQKALSILPTNEPLRIYVVQVSNETFLLHDTVEGYCKKNHIDFAP